MHRRFNRLAVAAAVLTLMGVVAASGQTRPTWETAISIESGVRGNMTGRVTSIDSARNTISLNSDGDAPGTPVRVTADTMTTRYFGFGTGTQMLSGSAGFRELRVGDRIQVYGTGRPNQIINAEEVRLVGRDVNAANSPAVADDPNVITGTVRQVSTQENRLVVENDRREIQTVYGTGTTPVYFGGGTYRISNIEVGDRVRVQVESRTRDGVRARMIDVLKDATPEETRDGRTLTSIAGRVTRIDARVSTIRMNLGRGSDIRVDMLAARDASGRNFRISDLQVGDRVEISGRYASEDTFRADTVRFAAGGDGRFDRNEEVFGPSRNDNDDDEDDDREVEDTEREFATVVLYGTVQSPLGSGDALVIRENDSDLQIHVVDDFVVRLANGSYVTADQLRRGDRVVVQAFRDDDERLIAQTIRTR